MTIIWMKNRKQIKSKTEPSAEPNEWGSLKNYYRRYKQRLKYYISCWWWSIFFYRMQQQCCYVCGCRRCSRLYCLSYRTQNTLYRMWTNWTWWQALWRVGKHCVWNCFCCSAAAAVSAPQIQKTHTTWNHFHTFLIVSYGTATTFACIVCTLHTRTTNKNTIYKVCVCVHEPVRHKMQRKKNYEIK